MALYAGRVTQEVVAGEGCTVEKVLQSTAYAKIMEAGARLAGDTTSIVTPKTMSAFARKHPDSPTVQRALNNNKAYDVVAGDIGGPETLMRIGRSGINEKTLVAVDSSEVIGKVVVLANVRLPSREKRSVADADAGIVPVGVQAIYGCGTAAKNLPKVDLYHRRLPRTKKRTRNSGAGKRKRAFDDDDDDEPPGIDLMDTDSEDDDEDECEDTDEDGFIVSDDHESGDADTSDDDFGENTANTTTTTTSSPPTSTITVPRKEEYVGDVLQQKHPVAAFDGRVFLYETGTLLLWDGTTVEADHTYVVDGQAGNYVSTTTVLKAYGGEFDPVAKSQSMVSSASWQSNRYYRATTTYADDKLAKQWKETSFRTDLRALSSDADRKVAKLFAEDRTVSFDVFLSALDGASTPSPFLAKLRKTLVDDHRALGAEYLQTEWKLARDLGTEMHERLEFFFTDQLTRAEIVQKESCVELGQFLDWYDTWLVPNGYEPYRMEIRIFDEEMRVSGSIDALFKQKETGKIIMVDWKRARAIYRKGFSGAKCTGPLAGMEDCNYIKYVMQQNMYKLIVERNTSLRIEEMYLLVCHPTHPKWDLIPISDMPDRIEAVREDRLKTVLNEAQPVKKV